MNIVVLDGYTLNPGDLSWNDLRALGTCTIHDRTPPEATVDRIGNAEMALTNKTVLSREIINQCRHVAYIGVLATGYNVIDTAAARECGIPVTNVPRYGTPSVAQMVFAHLLNLTQHVDEHARTVRDGAWTAGEDFCYWNAPLVELRDLTMGIVGFGEIGRATAQIARSFGMSVIAHDKNVTFPPDSHVESVELDDLFRRGDVITLHCPLTPETERLVNTERLALMKPSAFLINTSRGPVIDEEALAEALNTDKIAGAGLDVLTREPPTPDNPLLRARNCYVTPHIAWATRSARARLMSVVVENVRAFIEGQPQNVVNLDRCKPANIPPSRIVHVGDQPLDDVQGAQSAGLSAVLLDRDHAWPESDAPCILTLRDLPDTLVSLNG